MGTSSEDSRQDRARHNSQAFPDQYSVGAICCVTRTSCYPGDLAAVADNARPPSAAGFRANVGFGGQCEPKLPAMQEARPGPGLQSGADPTRRGARHARSRAGVATMKVDTTMGYREMELSPRSAFQHNDALPVEHGSPLGLAAELVQQGKVTLAEQGRSTTTQRRRSISPGRCRPPGKPQLGASTAYRSARRCAPSGHGGPEGR